MAPRGHSGSEERSGGQAVCVAGGTITIKKNVIYRNVLKPSQQIDYLIISSYGGPHSSPHHTGFYDSHYTD